MWTIKYDVISANGDELQRDYVENERGTKLISIGFDGRIENALEKFEYQDGGLSLRILATRVDQKTLEMLDFYNVWLGIALQTASIRRSPDFITLDRARGIARDLKEALSVWRYPGAIANILSCHSPVHDVVFDMRRWEKWDSHLEGKWP